MTQLLAIAEEFARSTLESRCSELERRYGGITANLLREVRRQGDESWERLRALYTLTGLRLSAAPMDQAVLGYVEARNAIAHGLGRLTPKQLRNRDRAVSLLRQAGIRTDSDRLVIGVATVEHCATTIADWITWIDERANIPT